MQAKKFVTVPAGPEVAEVTLLSVDEYKACREHVTSIDDWWWLRSPGHGSDHAASVNRDGGVSDYGYFVVIDYSAVRPALRVTNLSSVGLVPGDKFRAAGHGWTVISESLALCDEAITRMAFRKDWKAPDANDYEQSDVKAWIDAWAKDNGITIPERKEDMAQMAAR